MPGRRRTRAVGAATSSSEFHIDRVIAGRAWIRGKLQPVEIGINGEGRIARVARDVPSRTRLDFGDGVLLPSAVDLHVHFRDPGPPGSTEEFATGTLQAALGGVGLVCDMPNTVPVAASPEVLEEKASRARGRLAVDALLYALATTPARIAASSRVAGAFKLYLAPTTGVDHPPGGREIPPILEAVARTGLPLSVHAEDPGAFVKTDPPKNPVGWNAARPATAEQRGVREVLDRPRELRLHIAHVTTAEIADELRRAGVSFEVTPHHLLLHEKSGADPRFKVNPPLRAPGVQAALWEAYARGEVPLLSSDHAPHSIEAKQQPFALAPSGMPNVETMLPLLLARVREGALSLGVLQATAAERPAVWLGIPQGRLAPGFRANLVVVDFSNRRKLRADLLHAPAGWSAYEGREATFPTHHFLDGEAIVEDGEYVGTPRGRLLRPEYAAPGRSAPGETV